ncbi:Glycogen-binding subunit 76A [Halotydeus destructor]|nr:Glycogen-binding subunit 76A [Halotydeus destructor]
MSQSKTSILHEAKQLSLPPFGKKGKIPLSAYTDLKVPKEMVAKTKSTEYLYGRRWVSTTCPPTKYVPPPPQPKVLPPWMALYQVQQNSTLIPEFIEPSVQANFLDRVRRQKIGLENCFISSGAGSVSVTCVIRVANISFEKQVLIRFTVNGWKSHVDCLASYIPQSTDSWSDRFTATFHVITAAGGTLQAGQRVQFAVKYIGGGEEFWDSNNGKNYSLVYRV